MFGFKKRERPLNYWSFMYYSRPTLEITFNDNETLIHTPTFFKRNMLQYNWTDWIHKNVLDERFSLGNIKYVTVQKWEHITAHYKYPVKYMGSFSSPHPSAFGLYEWMTKDSIASITNNFTSPAEYK